MLEDTLLLHRVPAWAGSDRASLVAHPKLLFFDLGVRNALLRRPLDDERGRHEGPERERVNESEAIPARQFLEELPTV